MPRLSLKSIRVAGSPRVALLLAAALALLVFAIGAAVTTLGSVSDNTETVEHTLEVGAQINYLAALNERIETGRRGFMIQPNPAFVNTIRSTGEEFDNTISEIKALVADNPRQQERIEEIDRLDDERQEMVGSLLLTPATALAQARAIDFNRERGVIITRQIRDTAAQMAATEQQLLSLRNGRQLSSLVQLYTVGGVTLLLLFAVLGAVIVIILRYNRDLDLAQRGLQAANLGLEGAVAARTSELVRANQEIQRFAYIVSHDLRSPLVNVLGFTAELDAARKLLQGYIGGIAERHPALADEQVRIAVEEDLPEALGFIRASTEKMDRLITSILELSRQGRRELHPESLDLDALVDGVITTLHQRAAEAGTKLLAEPLPPLHSDRLAVEQIVSNLIENAIKYSAPGRAGEVRVSGRRAGETVQIDVIDNGRGIAPADHERIFELFRRSGQQDRPGEGIGLANVRALAYRLGGTIEVQSELDRGARFRLSLPVQFIETERS